MTTPLISLADVKSLLPIRAGNTQFDAQLTALILVATRQIEHFCRREFAKSVRTEYRTPRNTEVYGYDLHGQSETGVSAGVADQLMLLQASPVDTEAEFKVYYDPARVFGEDTLVPAENIFLDAQPTTATIHFRWPTRAVRNSVKLVYTAGFLSADGSLSASLPLDIKQAAIFQTVYMFNRSLPDDMGSSTRTEDGQTIEVERDAIVREAAALLAPYRKLLIGRG